MKRMKWIFAAMLPLFFTGCLTVDTIKTRIQIRGENIPSLLTIEYLGISSGEAKDEDIKKDFDYLISQWKGDDYLIDQAKKGIVVRDRRVWEEKGQINSSETGLVDDLDKLYDFWVENDERILLVEWDEEEYELVETNGKILKTDHNRLIWWPETEKDLFWTMKWISDSESIGKNRPVMLKMLKNYLKEEENKNN
jgi:hypothetical protein